MQLTRRGPGASGSAGGLAAGVLRRTLRNTSGHQKNRRQDRRRYQMLRDLCLLILFAALSLHAETGYNAWLRYAPLDEPALTQYRQATPAAIVALNSTGPESSARGEAIRGLRGMLGRTLRAETAIPKESAIVLGTLEEFRRAAPQFHLDATLAADAYWLKTVTIGPIRYTVVTA